MQLWMLGRFPVSDRYPAEVLDRDEDDGTMPDNVNELEAAVIGHRIIKAEQATGSGWDGDRLHGLTLTLDTGRRVHLINSGDRCAYTSVAEFLLHPDMVDHVITGVGTTDGFQQWHVYAALGDVLTVDVEWFPGHSFYYGYGFEIAIEDVPEAGA